MRVQKLQKRLLLITFCVAIISLTFSFQVGHTQTKPLTLAQVLTGLQSQSGGFTLAQKNAFITEQVNKKGVTFKLTTELERELRSAGASTSLIRIIRLRAARTTPTPRPNDVPVAKKPNATYDRIWVEQDIVENGVSGIRIYANFNVYNLKGIKSDIVYLFTKNGNRLKGKTVKFKTKRGDLSARRYLTPKYSATVYTELAAFVPYSEFALAPGLHRLRMEALVIKRNGTRVKKLTTQNVNLIMPSANAVRSKGIGTLGKFWVDYKVKQGNQWGMRVHVKMMVKNMKGETAYLRVLFTKEDGTPLKGLTRKYRTKSGQTALFRKLSPGHVTSNYNDIAMFIPYKEFGLPIGKYNLKMHTDLLSSSYQQISHLNYKSFTYTRSR